ncbi:NAD(P)-dependent dehydrogenase (short-subunit alcohol dehydrogenase family) [Novosphingobium chloroacetimidivorans]|uniref:NAD(P)-dependent dehydrogenase (Short-subunit alcohol dehydrogenase family) n=1 Tax=Novosphingobium chloroacetimidivorans TaxID=1428314 RepID=A0A7W7NUE1_9SPHN|nr:SDR family NAD(P)-dependent oxidoreductase [Novosphingobium chloroacetimidivorans]MBB4857121.1 NAD(P)-dependent dehydrogenase (short-subunit alcohol dehydrogenase family) [Novosphingobium chloroacetimidivorans]
MNQPAKRTVVITGASSGIGLASALEFARAGWHVIGTGRDPAHSAQGEAAIREAAGPDGRVDFLRGDFCDMADVKRIAGEIAGLTDRIDVLVNNAGGTRDAIYITNDGLEATFAANHLAPFLLTRELLPLLERAAADREAGAVRIIAVASSAHQHTPAMNWDDLQFRDGSAGAAYCQAKLANILYTRELNRRAADKGIIAQSMHPGMVDTNFASHGGKAMQDHFATHDAEGPEAAARTIFWLATSQEGGRDGGRYFHNQAEAPVAPQASDDAAAARLWQESEALLTGLGY